MAGLLAEFRAILDAAPGRMSVGELFTGDPVRAASYAAPRHLIFDFRLIETALAGRADWRGPSTMPWRPSAPIAGRPS